MAEALKQLPQSDHPDLLIGYNSADDAGVFRISETQALVQTLDFFPPIVDDPYFFGQIAAANALSDVYAMGGVPLTAMNIVGFPKGIFPPEVLSDLLRGGQEKIIEAGAVVVGGHSINDKEMKYGVSVTGLVHPGRVLSNSAAQTGDLLFLTKPLGTGIITTGIKRNAASTEETDLAVKSMAALNRVASELMIKHNAHSATDITGYGLLGHAYEMAVGSGVTIELNSSNFPLLPGAERLAKAGMLTGGANANREYVEKDTSFNPNLPEHIINIALDPQTSGGLLIALAEGDAKGLAHDLEAAGLWSKPIGLVKEKEEREEKKEYQLILN